MNPHGLVSYHCWCSVFLAGQTSHFSGKLDVKMSNYCACRDCGPSLHCIRKQHQEIIHIWAEDNKMVNCITSHASEVKWQTYFSLSKLALLFKDIQTGFIDYH